MTKRAQTHMVVITSRRVKFTPMAVSKLVSANKLVRWPIMLAISVGKQTVRKKPRRFLPMDISNTT